MATGFRVQLASRLKKAASDLYSFVDSPVIGDDRDKYIKAVADLIDVSAMEVEAEITQLKRTLGGLSAKTSCQSDRIAGLESELAVANAKLDKLYNDSSPISGMRAGYDG